MYDLSQSLIDFGRGMIIAPQAGVDAREGEIRDLGQFYVKQGYDFVKAGQNDTLNPVVAATPTPSDGSSTKKVDNNHIDDPFTDVNVGFVLSPSYYFSLGVDSNISTYNADFSSSSILFGFRDDRDDAIRTRYTYNEASVNQIEANIEIKLTEQLKLGTYGRYDAYGDQLMESQGLLRFSNSCNCWAIDLGVGKRINPDRSQVMVNFTLGGVGTLRQGFGVSQGQSQQQTN